MNETSPGSADDAIVTTFLAVELLAVLLPFLMIAVAWLIGTLNERRHYASIRTREAATASLPAVTLRSAFDGRPVADARLVTGHVVISIDKFKRLLAAWRKIFGGRVRSYESLVDRARREAVLRLKEQAAGADIILNLRLDTSNISQTSRDRGTGAIEVVASGTAVRYVT
jgi:uncharacterized protein YbjQ (UPF0145 family)